VVVGSVNGILEKGICDTPDEMEANNIPTDATYLASLRKKA